MSVETEASQRAQQEEDHLAPPELPVSPLPGVSLHPPAQASQPQLLAPNVWGMAGYRKEGKTKTNSPKILINQNSSKQNTQANFILQSYFTFR